MWFNNHRDKEVKRRSKVFNILNGTKILIEIFFLTREHELTSAKYQCRLDIRKYSFSERTLNEWNKLFTDCITAGKVNNIMFKHTVDTYLRRANYT